MSNTVKEYEHAGCTIKIYQDESPESPRDWDNLGTMICFHKRYNLGDKHDYRHEDYSGWEALQEAIREQEHAAIILPLYLYDHSGLRIKVGPFAGLLPQGHAEFDSGCVGFIVVSKEKVRKEYSVKKLSKSVLEKAAKVLQGEVETYDQYLSGDVYGYEVTNEETGLDDSCWGHYGLDYVEQEANSIAEHNAKTVSENVNYSI